MRIVPIHDLVIKFMSNGISAARFIDGGALMLAAIARKSHRDIEGATDRVPALNSRLRVFEDSYIVFAREKSQEDTSPWATIMIRLPVILHEENKRSLASIRPMWLTEAYAISDFMSG